MGDDGSKTMKKNWVYYMQQGLQSMWKKSVPDYRKKKKDTVWEDNALDLGRISAFGKVNKRKRLAKKVGSKSNTTNKNDTGWLPHEV